MTILAVMTTLFGAFLGLKFRVLILIPVAGIMLAAIVAEGVADHYGLLATTLAAVMATTCLEIGYLAGVVGCHLMDVRALHRGYPNLGAITALRRRA
jgi:hypothetical protein